MIFNFNNKNYEISVKHLSEYYDEYIKTNDVNIFNFYLDPDGIWRRSMLKWTFDYLLENEEYEKCDTLKDVIKNYYVANKEEIFELNEKLNKFKNNLI